MPTILNNMKKAIFDHEIVFMGGGQFTKDEMKEFINHIEGIKVLMKQAHMYLSHPDVVAVTNKFVMPGSMIVDNLKNAVEYLDS